MNYFTHAIRFLDADPHFIAGTAVPDWMSVADRKVRVRAKLATPVIESTDDDLTRNVAQGALQHLEDDDWFHRTLGFTEVTSSVARFFRKCLGPDDPMRCGFLGHIVTELLLDAALIERYPRKLDRYYELLEHVDAPRIETAVNQIARGETERLKLFIPLFHRERFLYDYQNDSSLLWRLNRVLERVNLSTLPDRVLEVLSGARSLVRDRLADLLPPQHFRLPVSD